MDPFRWPNSKWRCLTVSVIIPVSFHIKKRYPHFFSCSILIFSMCNCKQMICLCRKLAWKWEYCLRSSKINSLSLSLNFFMRNKILISLIVWNYRRAKSREGLHNAMPLWNKWIKIVITKVVSEFTPGKRYMQKKIKGVKPDFLMSHKKALMMKHQKISLLPLKGWRVRSIFNRVRGSFGK